MNALPSIRQFRKYLEPPHEKRNRAADATLGGEHEVSRLAEVGVAEARPAAVAEASIYDHELIGQIKMCLFAEIQQVVARGVQRIKEIQNAHLLDHAFQIPGVEPLLQDRDVAPVADGGHKNLLEQICSGSRRRNRLHKIIHILTRERDLLGCS